MIFVILLTDKCKEVMTGKVEMDDSTKCLHYCMEQKMTADVSHKIIKLKPFIHIICLV